MADLLQSIQIIGDLNFSLGKDEKLKIGEEIKEKLFFGNYLVKSNDVKTRLLFEQLITQLVFATTEHDMVQTQKELLQAVEEHMKTMNAGWRASYQELLSDAAFNLNLPQDKMDTISFQQALEYGYTPQSIYNKFGKNYLLLVEI